MTSIPVAVLEFVEGGRTIWVHDRKGSTVLRIQCTGTVQIDNGCTNICAHADINVKGSIEICIPSVKPKREAKPYLSPKAAQLLGLPPPETCE